MKKTVEKMTTADIKDMLESIDHKEILKTLCGIAHSNVSEKVVVYSDGEFETFPSNSRLTTNSFYVELEAGQGAEGSLDDDIFFIDNGDIDDYINDIDEKIYTTFKNERDKL